MSDGFGKKTLFWVISILFMVFIVSCGSGGGSDTNIEPTSSFSITGESGNQVSLNGTWSKECDPDIAEGESESAVATISGSNFSQEMNLWFNSTTCSGISDATVTMTASIVLGSELTATLEASNVTATEIDIAWDSYEGTLNNSDTVSQFNTNNECGLNDWVLNTPKDLLESECGPNSLQFDLLYIDDTVDPDVMLSGDDEEGAPVDGNGYPTRIDSDTRMERM